MVLTLGGDISSRAIGIRYDSGNQGNKNTEKILKIETPPRVVRYEPVMHAFNSWARPQLYTVYTYYYNNTQILIASSFVRTGISPKAGF